MRNDYGETNSSRSGVKRAFLRMAGLYCPSVSLFSMDLRTTNSRSAFLESSSRQMARGPKAGRTRWKFAGERLFPNGYEMKARSIEIDRDGQKKILGRVVIDDETNAMEFMEIVGAEGPLLEAVRKLRRDRRPQGIQRR